MTCWVPDGAKVGDPDTETSCTTLSFQPEKQNGKSSLIAVVFKTFKWSILAVIPPRLCMIGLTFCQPLLLHKAMELSAEEVSIESTHIGYGLIGAYILVYVGMAVCWFSIFPVLK